MYNLTSIIKILHRHARESLTPLSTAFKNELQALRTCARGEFVHGESSVVVNIPLVISTCSGTLEEMNNALESCLTVHSGISNQYLYRSLYGVQIHHCLQVVIVRKTLW